MKKDKSARRIIDELEKEEKVYFPIEKMAYIRTVCYELSVLRPGRQYSTSIDRSARVITVTRIK